MHSLLPKDRHFLYRMIFMGFIVTACGSDEPPVPDNTGNGGATNVAPGCLELTPPFPVFDETTDFPAWFSSPYKLPYTIGETYRVNQGNTSGFGHSGFWRYGYDFTMTIGTKILAARRGVVVHAQDGAKDGDRTRTNLITVIHADNTVALYSHLTFEGVFVNAGDTIAQGDLIGLSGDTGNTGDHPHLHFSVHPCAELPGLPNAGDCPTQPITFRNTEPNPDGLGTGKCYTAE